MRFGGIWGDPRSGVNPGVEHLTWGSERIARPFASLSQIAKVAFPAGRAPSRPATKLWAALISPGPTRGAASPTREMFWVLDVSTCSATSACSGSHSSGFSRRLCAGQIHACSTWAVDALCQMAIWSLQEQNWVRNDGVPCKGTHARAA